MAVPQETLDDDEHMRLHQEKRDGEGGQMLIVCSAQVNERRIKAS